MSEVCIVESRVQTPASAPLPYGRLFKSVSAETMTLNETHQSQGTRQDYKFHPYAATLRAVGDFEGG